MRIPKIAISFFVLVLLSQAAFCQTEMLKNVVNNLAFYRQKKDTKFLANAKKSVDSLFTTHADTLNVEKSVYRAVVNATILYIDSLNKLKQPDSFFAQTVAWTDKLIANKRNFRYQVEMDYIRACITNVYIRKAFVYVGTTDYINALSSFQAAEKYTPSFKPLKAYIAYSNARLGNLQAAAKNYSILINDTTKSEYVEAASSIYKLVGDTVTALDILKKGEKLLPNDKSLLLDEANIYNNRKDYRSLATLIPRLLEINNNSADIAFVSANCYDRLNQYDKAESLYLRSIELNGVAYDPVLNLGILYFKLSAIDAKNKTQNTEHAIQWLEKANEMSPNDANCLHALQMAYAQTGNQNQLNRINDKLQQLNNQ